MLNQPVQFFKPSFVRIIVVAALVLAALSGRALAQQNGASVSPAGTPVSAVPQIIQFSGIVRDGAATVPSGTVSITFTLYENEQGGTALWSETDNVQVDAQGHYTALLGSASPDGLPFNLFTSGQAHWLAVQPLLQGFAEQPRVLLVSAPYALKALDAETIGGKPASAFMPAPAQEATSSSAAAAATSSAPVAAPASRGNNKGAPSPATVTGSGTAGYLPIWKTSHELADSLLFEDSTSDNVELDTSNTTEALFVTQTGTGNGVESSTTTGPAVLGAASATSGKVYAVVGQTVSSGGSAVYGNALGTSGNVSGVIGSTSAPSGYGVGGVAKSTTGDAEGVRGETSAHNGEGVVGLATDTTGDADGVMGQTSAPSGSGVLGSVTTTTGGAYGVRGTTASDAGAALEGDATNDSGIAQGVSGTTASVDSVAIYGQGVAGSAEGAAASFRPLGVWGDTSGNEGTGAAVLGTIDQGVAVAGYSNYASIATANFENDESTGVSAVVLAALGKHYGGICIMDVQGNLGCNGSKSAVVPVDGGSRQVALYAVEAPENWFEDFGSGHLSGGTSIITLDPTFAQTVNTGEDYHVFLTPNGDCKGLFVTQKTETSFEVRELGGGKSNVPFDYRIVARRKGFENIRLADKTQQFKDVVATSERGRAGGQRPPHPAPVAAIAPMQLVPPARPSTGAGHTD
jgi:hypothetical protein